MTRDFLQAHLENCAYLLEDLNDLTEESVFRSEVGSLKEDCLQAIDQAGEKYARTYAKKWSTAYLEKKLKSLESLNESKGWAGLVTELKQRKQAEVRKEFEEALQELLGAIHFWRWYDEQGEWLTTNFGETGWDHIKQWMKPAIDAAWPNADDYENRKTDILDLMDSAKRAPSSPWDAVGGVLGDELERFLSEIAKGNLDRSDAKDGVVPKIGFGKIEESRQRWFLEREKQLTGSIIEFERHAQDLLTRKLTEIVVDKQEQFFPGRRPYEGWPYLPDRDNKLATVQMSKFEDFLEEITSIRESFAELEKGLPENNSTTQERRRFYEACHEWSEFLMLNKDNEDERVLRFEVKRNEVQRFGLDDTFQHYFKTCELNMDGIEVKAGDGSEYRADPLRVVIVGKGQGDKVSALWRWTGTPLSGPAYFAFTDPLLRDDKKEIPKSRQELGLNSRLAFPAYLHRYNKEGAKKKWAVVHSLDLRKVLNKDDERPIRGEVLSFTLRHELPRPIVPLERPSEWGSQPEDQ